MKEHDKYPREALTARPSQRSERYRHAAYDTSRSGISSSSSSIASPPPSAAKATPGCALQNVQKAARIQPTSPIAISGRIPPSGGPGAAHHRFPPFLQSRKHTESARQDVQNADQILAPSIELVLDAASRVSFQDASGQDPEGKLLREALARTPASPPSAAAPSPSVP